MLVTSDVVNSPQKKFQAAKEIQTQDSLAEKSGKVDLEQTVGKLASLAVLAMSAPEQAPLQDKVIRGNKILEAFQFNPETIDMTQIAKEIGKKFPSKDLLGKEAREDLYHKCIAEIPSYMTKFQRPIAKAFVASNMRGDICLPLARAGMKDRFLAERLLPSRDQYEYGGNIRDNFAYFVNKYSKVDTNGDLDEAATADAIIQGSKSANEWIDTLVKWTYSTESDVIAAGKTASSYSEFLGREISRYPFSSPVFAALSGLVTLLPQLLSSQYSIPGIKFGMFAPPLAASIAYFLPHIAMSGASSHSESARSSFKDWMVSNPNHAQLPTSFLTQDTSTFSTHSNLSTSSICALIENQNSDRTGSPVVGDLENPEAAASQGFNYKTVGTGAKYGALAGLGGWTICWDYLSVDRLLKTISAAAAQKMTFIHLRTNKDYLKTMTIGMISLFPIIAVVAGAAIGAVGGTLAALNK